MARRSSVLDGTSAFLMGSVVGVGLTMLLDPVSGSRRRSLVRDKFNHGLRLAGREAKRGVRHLRNTVQGGIAERQSWIRERNQLISDERLLRRVRSQLGHVVRHLHQLDILVEQGAVLVRGRVEPGERLQIAERLGKTRGVRDFEVQVEEATAVRQAS